MDDFALDRILRALARIAHALECIERDQQAVLLGAEHDDSYPVDIQAQYDAMLANNKWQAEQEEANMPETLEDFYRQEGTLYMNEEQRNAYYQGIMEEAHEEITRA